MSDTAESGTGDTSAFQRFEELARRLVHVPKKEVDKKEAERPKRERKQRSA